MKKEIINELIYLVRQLKQILYLNLKDDEKINNFLEIIATLDSYIKQLTPDTEE